MKHWLFNPNEHNGAGNMFVFWLSIGTGAIGFIIWLINQIFKLW